jgi:signal peptidase II
MAAEPDAGGDHLDDAAVRTTTIRAVVRPPARARRAHWSLFAGLAAGVAVADQLAKAWILANVDPARPVRVVDDYLRLVISHNAGALFGMFQGQAPIFAAVSFGVMALIVAYHARAGSALIMSVALGLLLGGAIGNVIDRLRFGYVLDFVDAGIGAIRWYTFNVADSAISFALVLLTVVALRPSLASDGVTDRRTDAGTDA